MSLAGAAGGYSGAEPETLNRQRAGKAQIAWLLTWAGWWVLLLQQITDAWIHSAPWIIWLAKLLPLAMFVPGMLRDRLRSFIWLCFVCLLYFISLVERIFAVPDSLLAGAGLVAVVTLFCAAMLYVRWRARDLRASRDGSTQGE